ncbi:dual serine/threonine and tyrosine protein kinase-like [Ptychodera flava]|uniref:dual serine/threonine and tyrosine protein kinase-like n=1 Tax=Ptychodera flava TaxID=63121 RepID=UPI00396A94B2
MATDRVDDTFASHIEKKRKINETISYTEALQHLIEQLLETPIAQKLILEDEDIEIRETLEQTSVIAVTGERNCGKSSLINALLDQWVMPAADSPCTSRVVRVKYSKDPHAILVNFDGTAVEDSKLQLQGTKQGEKHDRQTLRRLAVLKEEDREDKELVKQMVEVGLDHPLLQCGVQIVDSPGKNENETLDQVVQEFTKATSIPVLIYVIDGKNSLRSSDMASIQFFKEKCLDTRIVYVCNKVDVDTRAKEMDRGSDEESDEEDAPTVARSTNMGVRVRGELSDCCLLDERSSKEVYHAISVREVRKARRQSQSNPEEGDLGSNEYIRNFETFKEDVMLFLRAHFNKLVLKAIEKLEECHSRCFYSFSSKQRGIEEEGMEMTKALEDASSSEERLFEQLVEAVDSKTDRIKAIVSGAVTLIEEDTMNMAKRLKLQKVIAYDHFLKCPDITEQFEKHILEDQKFSKLHAFCYEIRNYIVNKVFRKVEEDLESLLENDVASAVWPFIIETMDVLDNPTLKRNLDTAYQFFGAETTQCRDQTRKSLAGLVFSLLRAVKSALSTALQRTYAVLPMVGTARMFYEDYVGQRRLNNDQKQDVARHLISKLDTNEIALSIVSSCREAMSHNHRLFGESLKKIDWLKTEVQVQHLEHLEAIRSKVIWELAQIDVRNRALKYAITKGKPILGEILHRGKHSAIHNLAEGWQLTDPDKYVVRVFQGSQEECKHGITNLYYAFNCGESEYFAGIDGWSLPESWSLYVVMEKAATSLDQANLSPRQRLEVTLDVVRGIDVIHSRNFVYRDLKANNILITADNRAKINICKGKYEALHGQAANFDIQQIGELLLWLHGGETIEGNPTGSLRIRKPKECDGRVSKLIDRCVAWRNKITIRDIIFELQAILRDFNG